MKTRDEIQDDVNSEMKSKDLNRDEGLGRQAVPHSKGLEESKSNSDSDTEAQTVDNKQKEIKELKKERDLLKKASETNLSKVQYLLADYDNYRKQIEKID